MEFCNKCHCQRVCCPICHCCDACCRCHQCPPPVSVTFTLLKRNSQTGAAVAGAVYTLYQNGQTVATATSGASGALNFVGINAGCYELIEISAPAGYEQDTASHQVVVNAAGNVTIDNESASGYLLYNRPAVTAALTFTKVNASTGAGLAGAAFRLSNGATATSGANGLVHFDALTPGTYTMQETAAPSGYVLDTSSYTVAVSETGAVTINGTAADSFQFRNTPAQSARPAVNSITAGDATITGTGVPGAQITVTFPDGKIETSTVDSSGLWVVDVPAGTTLEANSTVYARQQVKGMAPSAEITMTVKQKTKTS